MQACPFCGAMDQQPIEDGWYCAACSKEYPTLAFKCPSAGCWQFQSLCTEHLKAPERSAKTMSREALESAGLWIGFGVFAMLGIALYFANSFLSSALDAQWASLILALPAFAAIFVVIPVRNRYVSYMSRRFCEKNGHQLDHVAHIDKSSPVFCRRCRRPIVIQ